MTRLAIIFSFLFATPAWAGEVELLKCIFSDGSEDLLMVDVSEPSMQQKHYLDYCKSSYRAYCEKQKCDTTTNLITCSGDTSYGRSVSTLDRYTLEYETKMQYRDERPTQTIRASCEKIKRQL